MDTLVSDNFRFTVVDNSGKVLAAGDEPPDTGMVRDFLRKHSTVAVLDWMRRRAMQYILNAQGVVAGRECVMEVEDEGTFTARTEGRA